MGVKVVVPRFTLELPDSMGNDPDHIKEVLFSHYKEFHHFLEENAPKEGWAVVYVNDTQFVDVVWKKDEENT